MLVSFILPEQSDHLLPSTPFGIYHGYPWSREEIKSMGFLNNHIALMDDIEPETPDKKLKKSEK